MPEDLQEFAIRTAKEGMERHSTEREVASYIKKEFDRLYGPSPNWHCFVGRNFGSYVTHEANNYTYFYLGQMGFLIFKSG